MVGGHDELGAAVTVGVAVTVDVTVTVAVGEAVVAVQPDMRLMAMTIRTMNVTLVTTPPTMGRVMTLSRATLSPGDVVANAST